MLLIRRLASSLCFSCEAAHVVLLHDLKLSFLVYKERNIGVVFSWIMMMLSKRLSQIDIIKIQ